MGVHLCQHMSVHVSPVNTVTQGEETGEKQEEGQEQSVLRLTAEHWNRLSEQVTGGKLCIWELFLRQLFFNRAKVKCIYTCTCMNVYKGLQCVCVCLSVIFVGKGMISSQQSLHVYIHNYVLSLLESEST